MDQQTPFHQKAQQIAQDQGFHIREKIYEAWEPGRPIPRNIIYLGTWREKRAAFKIYDERRISDEPLALQAWLRHNTSRELIAPALYDFAIASPHQGWLIMEELPRPGNFFVSPMSLDDREQFLKLYRLYRAGFPTQPTRPLSIAERLSAAEYQQYRIHRWFELAVHAEEARRVRGEPPLLPEETFVPLYADAMKLLQELFANRPMVWSHGHFKPKEIYHDQTLHRYYLTDFAHVKMYPQGYELGFMVWADYLMIDNWHLPYEQWVLPVRAWMERLMVLATDLKIDRESALIQGSMIERTLGTIFADIIARDHSRQKQEQHLALMLRLLRELIGMKR